MGRIGPIGQIRLIGRISSLSPIRYPNTQHQAPNTSPSTPFSSAGGSVPLIRKLLAISLILLSGISASAAAPKTQDQILLRVWALPLKEDRSIPQKASYAIVRRFMELHPEIKLEGFRGITAPGLDQEVGPLLAMAGGVAPDVLYVNFRISDSYIQQGFLYPLDEYVKDWAKREDLSKRIYPPVWQVIRREGHVWAIPFQTYLMAMAYRKDLFREAGLDPERAPKNWDELYEYAKKLTIPEKGQYGIAVFSGPHAAWWFVDFLWSAGGEAVREDAKGNWHAVFNDDAAVSALEFYQKLGRSRWSRNGKQYMGVAYRDTDYAKLWTLGKIGMTFTYLNDEMLATVNPSLVGIGPVPLGPTGLRGNELNCAMMGINSQTKDKRVRDAAWKYIEFWGSEEATKIRCQYYIESGMARFVSPKLLRRYGYKQYLKEVPKGWEQTFDAALSAGRPEPYGRNCENIYSEMTPPLDKVWLKDTVNYKAELDKAVAHCNEKLMGIVPPEIMTFRRRVAAIVVLGLALFFTLIFRFVVKSFTRDYESFETEGGRKLRRKARGAKRRRTIFAFLIMAPALVSVALWAYYPLARGSMMAFQDYKVILGSKWVGLDNFSEVLFTPQVWKALWNSFQFMLLSLGLGFFTPIILALMLHEVPRGKVLYRTLYYLPAVTTGLVIMFLWKFFYNPSPAGLLNRMLDSVNSAILMHANAALAFAHIPAKIPLIPTQTWLGDPKLAMLCVVLPIIWAHVGPGCIIYLAALKSIPEDVYEAADLDGAGILHKIRHITIPYLRPLIIINFVGAFISAFRSFDFIFVMTGGGPMYATHVAGLEIWYNAFLYLKFGYAVAMAWLLGSLLVGFTVFQLRILSRLQFKTAGA